MGLAVYGILSLVSSFALKIVMLPALVVLGLLIYVGVLRFSHLLTTDDVYFVRDMMPRSLHPVLPRIARLVGLNYDLSESEKC